MVTNNRRPRTPGGDAETTAREITDAGGQAAPFFGDISKFDVAEQLIQTAARSFGRLDILVNNAGAISPRPIWEMTEQDWDTVVDCNLKGSFNCIRQACPFMIE